MLFIRALILGLALFSGMAAAQYPDKARPLRIIVAQGPGSASDLVARGFGKAITDATGWTVIMDYKPGAEGVIGVQSLMNSPADGYTMLIVSSSVSVLNPVMVPNLPYDPLHDLVPLVGVSKSVMMFNLGPSTNFRSAHEFLAAAKANPGKYTFASSTSTTRLAGELLQALAGVKLLNVPYKTTAAGSTALASGEVDLFMVDTSSIRAFWDSGRARALAVSSATRVSGQPDLPTLREEGVANYDLVNWYASYVSARTPPEIVATMRDVLRKVGKAPAFEEMLTKANMEHYEATGDEISNAIRRDMESATKVMRAANLLPAK
jgi:tripartite-type tricarboxylate transporter receptor subunit TctC